MIVCFGIVAVVVVVVVDVSVSLRVFLRFALIELVCVCVRAIDHNTTEYTSHHW